jgi:hypothetical protein
MNEADWYDVTQGPALLQGDILFRCPVFTVASDLTWPLRKDTALDVEFVDFDLVVMSQSCDLENDRVDDVLLAELIAWPEAVRSEVQRGNPHIKSRDFRKKLIEGSIPGLSLFHKHENEPSLTWSVVDFHRLFTLPKPFASEFAASRGPRLRLRSPYREHLAQAFARYFMRVGLPHDAKAFEKEGDVKL